MNTARRYAVVTESGKVLSETNGKAEAVRYARAMAFLLRAGVRVLDRRGLAWVV